MSDQILEYTPEIDEKIKEVVPKILNTNVKKIERITQGEVNYVYKIETENQALLVRVARYKDWPKIDKLIWISDQLAKVEIPHAKVLFSDTASKYFKFGFIISEWTEGEDGMSLIKRNKLTRKIAVKKIAKTLSKTHKIKVEGFGEFNRDGKAIYKTWEESVFSFLEDSLYKRAVKENKYENHLNRKGIENIKRIIKEINYKPNSVLCHRDPTPENVIFNDDKIVLIDWDNAIGSTWIEDLAWITFWMGKKARNWFFETYKSNEPLSLVEKVERIIHLRLAITNIPYYFYSAKNYKAGERMKRKLRSLVLS